jgi:predicted nucleotidyltransferase
MNKSTTRKELTDKEIMSLLKKHKDLLKKYMVRRIGLFGSYVRGEQKRGSDIDFLVEFEEPNFDNFMDLSSSLEDYVENNSVIPSPLVGEGTGEGGPYDIHPHLHPPPSRGRIILANFHGSCLPAGRQG